MFSHPIRIYWEDTDAGGVVYHANYVRFFERARSEWLRAKGVVQGHVALSERVLFAVYAMRLEFKRPARLDDALHATVQLLHCRRASMKFGQSLIRDGTDEVLCRAEVDVASLGADDFRPCPIPPDLYKEIVRGE
jgi:acyl-CoA thioester hydrolase